ncbi:MAG: TonB-dependent receptor, partial [Geminicoccaceae bacterium]|nr:TonB-dependent receptor [Geminicoccaceae bacterium]
MSLLLILSTSPLAAAEPCSPVIGELVSVEGRVELARSAAGSFEPARRGDALCLGDALRTGPLSRAAVALQNESVLRLDERSELVLRTSEPAERSLIDVVLGAIYFFSHRPRALQIDTPFVNAGAEGTEFLVRVAADEALIVVYDGRVVARNDRGELGLGSGDAAVATATSPPVPRTIVRPRDLVAWAIYYPPVLAPLAGGEAPLPAPLTEAARAADAGDYPAALAALDRVPEADRDARWFTYRAGILLGVGRVGAAARAIEQALAVDPAAADALATRAVIKVARNDTLGALEDSARAVEQAPGSAPARIARSYALQARADIEGARATLLEAADAAPDDALVFARLAEIELSLGHLDAALDAAERAVALAPDLARTQMVLGYAELVRIDTEDALQAFDRSIELDQANPLSHLGRGLAFIRNGDLEAGRRELEIAVGLDPEDAVIRSYLGKAFFEEHRDERSAEQLAIAKRLDPNDPTPWFYNAIRLQLENRPVEALQDLETAIDLNDNRAVYRSSLLLDQDLATRSVSLARIYDDLGFDQLAVTEASQSLSRDPSNWSAHRFLSDAYARLPRHEVARVSELLQAQLLQPININPVQPSLPYTDLNVVRGLGPAEGAFNEFHPLFERDQVQVTATGFVGTNDTIGDEVVVSGLYDRFSVSAGQFHSGSDGFRRSNDSDNDLYDLFAQVDVNPSINLQAEYRRRETRQGDLELRFDPAVVFGSQRRRVDQDVFRIGGRWSPTPGIDTIASAFVVDRDEEFPIFGDTVEDDGYQAEGQLLYSSDWANLVTGAGTYDIDVDEVFFGTSFDFTREQDNVYAYLELATPLDSVLTLGLSYDRFEQDQQDTDELNPKVGFEWNLTDRVRLRAAAFRVLKRALVTQQTIEPTQVAGFNQFFDDFNGTTSWRYGVGLDVQLTGVLYAGVEGSWRDIEVPVPLPDRIEIQDEDEQLVRTYLYWAPHPDWAFSLEPT